MKRMPLRSVRRMLIGSLAICSVLLLLTSCGKKQYSTPYGQYTPPRATPYTRPAPPRQAPEVVEKCPVEDSGPRTVTHEVAPLETIWRISKMYDVPPERIYAANGLRKGDQIHIGQKLTIPNAKPLRHVINLYPSIRWHYIVIHHTATDIGNASLIHRAHGDRGFWNGIGYHFIIDNGTMGKGDGQIEAAPRWIKQQQGAHCKAGNMNDKSIGIALVGDFTNELPTEKQMKSLAYLLKTLCQYYRIPRSNVTGHGDVEGAKTACPGKRFPMQTVRQCLTGF